MWFTGSQCCEELFCLLRSMTPVFSTIINFSMKGMMERIHRLAYISSIECSDEIVFTRVKRRLQIKNIKLHIVTDIKISVATSLTV